MSYKIMATQSLPTIVLNAESYDDLLGIHKATGLVFPEFTTGIYEGFCTTSGIFICKLIKN